MNRITLAALLLLLPFAAMADDPVVYKVEKNGKLEYSTKPGAKGAKPAKLPEIGHWKIETPKVLSTTCETHGGVDCSAGPDDDGSVQCRDHFKDAVLRFKFECSAAKLEIVHIGDPKEDGSFTVSIRNSKSVVAQKSSVVFKPQRFQDGVALAGPNEIDGFGVGDFTFFPKKKGSASQKPKQSQLIVTCDNCG